MKIFCLATNDKRKRWKFVKEPLEHLGKEVNILDFTSDRKYTYALYRTIAHLQEGDLKIIIVYGGIKSVIVSLIFRFFGQKVVYRIAGDIEKVPESRAKSAIKNGDYKSYFREKISKFANMLLIRISNCLVTVNNELKNKIKNKKPKKSICVIPQYLQCDHSQLSNCDNYSSDVNFNPKKVVTITDLKYLEKAKGVIWLLNCINEFCLDYRKKIEFFIAGGGDNAYLIREYLNKLDNDFLKVHFLGFVRNVNNILQSSDIFVYYSNLDAVPNVILEAMCNNVPVLVNDNRNFHDIIENGQSGIFYADKNQFQNSLYRLVNNGEFRLAVGQYAKKMLLREFSLESVGLKWDNILLELEKEHKNRNI